MYDFKLTALHIRVSKYRPPASKQASHFIKLFIDSQRSSSLKLTAFLGK